MNDAQREAIATADAHTSNAGLPTYSELVAVLRLLPDANCPEAIAFVTQRANTLLARIPI